jgi:hypothetical protein
MTNGVALVYFKQLGCPGCEYLERVTFNKLHQIKEFTKYMSFGTVGSIYIMNTAVVYMRRRDFLMAAGAVVGAGLFYLSRLATDTRPPAAGLQRGLEPCLRLPRGGSWSRATSTRC